jgi:hypothetical protein
MVARLGRGQKLGYSLDTAWMTAMRDRIYLEQHTEAYGRKKARLARLDNTTRAVHTGYNAVWTRKQKNARRRVRKMRLVFREVAPHTIKPFLVR